MHAKQKKKIKIEGRGSNQEEGDDGALLESLHHPMHAVLSNHGGQHAQHEEPQRRLPEEGADDEVLRHCRQRREHLSNVGGW